jgi:hypothetical protein
MRSPLLPIALIASVLLTANAFSADAKKSQHRKHHAAHSQAQQHVTVQKPQHSGHQSAVNKSGGKAHAKKHSRNV